METDTTTSEGDGVGVGKGLKVTSEGEQFVELASGAPFGTLSDNPPSAATRNTRALGVMKTPPDGKDTDVPEEDL
jgi:hypothetical protein